MSATGIASRPVLSCHKQAGGALLSVLGEKVRSSQEKHSELQTNLVRRIVVEASNFVSKLFPESQITQVLC